MSDWPIMCYVCMHLTLQHHEQDRCEHRESVFQKAEALKVVFQQIKQWLMGEKRQL